MNPVLACVFRRDLSALNRLLSGFDAQHALSQDQLDEGLKVVVTDTNIGDALRMEFAELMLTAGANRDLYIGQDPLIHYTVSHGDQPMTMMLLYQFTCYFDAKSKDDGKTPLHIAVDNLNDEMLNMLLSVGANTNAVQDNGETPLHSLIYKFAKSRNLTDGDGSSARETKLINIFQSLLPLTDLKVVNSEGSSVLHTAVKVDMPQELIIEMIQAGADINRANHYGSTPLCVACQCANYQAATALLASKCNTNIVSVGGCTAMYFAALHLGNGMIQQLIENSACINTANEKGQLPLHASVSTGNVSATRELILSNCSFDNFGKLIYENDMKIITLNNSKLTTYSLDNLRRYWTHIDFVELAMLVTAGCPFDSSVDSIEVVQGMALDINTGKPGNWRSSLYGIKNGYNLQTLFLAAELLQAYAIRAPPLKHICRLKIRKVIGNCNNQTSDAAFSSVVNTIGLPEPLVSYVSLSELQALQVSFQSVSVVS